MPSIRSDLWCMAFIRRHNDLGHMCVVVQRGDPIAGQVFIDVDHMDGTRSLFTPAPFVSRGEGVGPIFQRRFQRVEPSRVHERIEQEKRFDPDLWVLGLDLRTDDPGIEIVSPDENRR
ncbi:DUF1491 family protein [Devosia oryzisoli]